MDGRKDLDGLFREAVAAIDAADIPALHDLLTAQPRLVRERLDVPGEWLREQVGNALDGFFQKPYLLWFVAEDPVRNGTLPANIAEVARVIIEAARRDGAESLGEQLDYALRLVAWSTVARECGVQIALIDVLVDAGASPAGNASNALVNGNIAAAAHLIERGDPLSLATAVCLEHWDEAERLAPTATTPQKQFALTLTALNGKAEAVARLLRLGVDRSAPSADLYSHATPLHHAVSSGSLETVRVLVEAGADLQAKDTAFGGTPLGWAEHYLGQQGQEEMPGKQYGAIAAYLREKAAQP